MGDPISLIMAALVAGAAKTAGEAISDGYKGLKDLIKHKLDEKKQPAFVQGMLDASRDQLEDQGTQDLLKEKLIAAEVHKDEEILKAAEVLIESIQSNQEQSSSPQNFNNQINAKNFFAQQGHENIAKDIRFN